MKTSEIKKLIDMSHLELAKRLTDAKMPTMARRVADPLSPICGAKLFSFSYSELKKLEDAQPRRERSIKNFVEVRAFMHLLLVEYQMHQLCLKHLKYLLVSCNVACTAKV